MLTNFDMVPRTDELGIESSAAVHVGDDLVADKQGAIAVGINAWCVAHMQVVFGAPVNGLLTISRVAARLWKKEVKTFEEIANRILKPVKS